MPAESLRRFVPNNVYIQEFNGTSWIGVVPFRMQNLTRRGVPKLPWISAFPELNVRIYVEHNGRPGVWFLSLDATNPLAVWAARRWFHLPYRRCRLRVTHDAGFIDYRGERNGETFHARYRGVGEPFEAKPGTLEAFLTERYCLYAKSPRGVLYRGEVHHHPWPLRRAECTIDATAWLHGHGISVSGEPHLLVTPGVDVAVWSLVPAV